MGVRELGLLVGGEVGGEGAVGEAAAALVLAGGARLRRRRRMRRRRRRRRVCGRDWLLGRCGVIF